ncbi:MAG: asparagine synthase (glutamine-hydrolyzing) [Deltaproteobacteria bacterium]|nr:asparagine synthase (glutamine-hydrolyzing) [Deltaproteobacteria bacterium]
MCGICGYVGLDDRELAEAMTSAITHRGPDDAGIFHGPGVALGHRRLSVIDLAGGHQPVFSGDERYALVYNGEIYNYRELRLELESAGVSFTTASDTEVLLQLLVRYGEGALNKLNGMFAFAFWDKRSRRLLLARDRVGIKPLYYLHQGSRLLFSSETKSILQYRGADLTVNNTGVHDYLALRYVPGSTTLFNEIHRLPAAHYAVFENERFSLHRYWTPRTDAPTRKGSSEDHYQAFKAELTSSVRRRLVADVPLGAYLSGGVDSSVIVALMAKLSSGSVKTFSVGFDYEHDELTEAAATARQLGAHHTEIACRASDIELLPDVVHHSDEPLGDAIAIPMYQLAREAKKQVTVVLTGEGGDEILGGYLFHKVLRLGELYRRLLPKTVRKRVLEPLIAAVPTDLLNTAFQYPAYLGERGKQKALDYLDMVEPDALDPAYRHLMSLFDARETHSLYTPEFLHTLERSGALSPSRRISQVNLREPFFQRMLDLSYDHWLPDNMLLRTDKMSMAHAIEARVPFLDHTLIEFCRTLPDHVKMRFLEGKWILRRLAKELELPAVAKRRKMPFYVPVETYFEQPAFKAMFNDILSEKAIKERGIFRVEAIRDIQNRMHKKEFVLVKQMFAVVVLELWFRAFADKRPGA